MNVTKFTLSTLGLLVILSTVGCKSQGSRMASWRPLAAWSKKEADEPTSLASSAPALPSSQFQPDSPTGSAVASTSRIPASTTASNTLESAPAFVPSQSVAQVSSTTPPATSGLAMAPQSSPYSNSDYVETSPATSLPNTTSIAATHEQAPADRYAAYDRYVTSGTSATGTASTEPSVTPGTMFPPATTAPVPTPTADSLAAVPSAGGDRYSRYDAPAVVNNAASSIATTGPTAILPTQQPAPSPTASLGQGTVASVALPTTPGGYRPGGTSTYNPAGTASFNVATRPENAESSRYAPARYPEVTPDGTMPAPSYNVPSYR